jgi:hypothetical protein
MSRRTSPYHARAGSVSQAFDTRTAITVASHTRSAIALPMDARAAAASAFHAIPRTKRSSAPQYCGPTRHPRNDACTDDPRSPRGVGADSEHRRAQIAPQGVRWPSPPCEELELCLAHLR